MKILAISPHADDIELGCGATIHKLSKDNQVFVVVFSTCDNPSLADECQSAKKVLGYKSVIINNIKVRHFDRDRQIIMDLLYSLNENVEPDLVFCPSTTDTHTDHWTTCRESIKSFKNSKILGYNLPWNNIQSTNHTCFSEVSQEDVNAKISALRCYQSQKDRSYFNTSYQLSLIETSGVKAGLTLAEEFEVIRWYL